MWHLYYIQTWDEWVLLSWNRRNTQVLYREENVTQENFTGLVRRNLWDSLEWSICDKVETGEESMENRRKHMKGKNMENITLPSSIVSSMQCNIHELLTRSHFRTGCSIVSWVVPKLTSWRRQDEDRRRKHNWCVSEHRTLTFKHTIRCCWGQCSVSQSSSL